MSQRTIVCVALALVLLAGTGFIVLAGDVNPPPGPIGPTMRTNQEIYDAVLAVGGSSGGAVCTQAISGANRGFGAFAFSTLPGTGANPVVSLAYAHQHDIAVSFGGGGGGSGVANVGFFTFTRDIDGSSFRIMRACVTGTHLPMATYTIFSGAQGVVEYRFTDVRIAGIKSRMIERCDGTTAQVEDVSIKFEIFRLTDLATGNFFEWNLGTGSGTGG